MPIKPRSGQWYEVTFRGNSNVLEAVKELEPGLWRFTDSEGNRFKIKTSKINGLADPPDDDTPKNDLPEDTEADDRANNRGFSHFELKWDDENIRCRTQVKDIKFLIEWRKKMGRLSTWPYAEAVGHEINITANRNGKVHNVERIDYENDPRHNMKSLNGDICACLTKWLHNHPFPGATCIFCGCPDHVADTHPVEACVKYLRSMIKTATVTMHRLTTIDNLILRLKEFRDTAIRAGGQRGFMLNGDTPGSQEVWINVDLTAQAMGLKGKVPGLRTGGAIDSAVGRGEPRDRSASNLSSKASSSSVQALLSQLATVTDAKEKRKIRAALRNMGHKGGARAVGGDE